MGNSYMQSRQARVTIAVGSAAMYVVVFVLLRRYGPQMATLSLLPVALAGWLFGMRIGLLAGLLVIPLNTVLLNLVGVSGWDALIQAGGAPGATIVVLGGAMVGRLHDLSDVVGTELTERKQAEEALRESEQRLRNLFETMTEGVVMIAPDGQIVQANSAAERILKLKHSEIERRNYVGPEWKILRTDGTSMPPEEMAGPRAMKERRPMTDVEMGITHTDGSISWINTNAAPHIDGTGELTGVVGTFADITERKQAEEALRARTSDLSGRVMQMDCLTGMTALLGIQGVSLDEILHRTVELIPPACRHPDITFAWIIFDNREVSTDNFQETAWKQVHDLMVDDKPVGTLEVCRLEERPGGNEEPFLEEEKNLFTAVAEGIEAIIDLKQTEEASIRLIDELDAFAHTVAHDLKTPLASIIGFVQVLEVGYAAMSGEERQDILSSIVRGSQMMDNIIEELLLLASVRKADLEMAPLDMASVVVEVQQRLSHIVDKHQAEIVLPDTWPVALGYGPWLGEVWANYLINAIEYGGRPPQVELGATVQSDGMVRFWIRDNGSGISPEDRQHLFTPFTQISQARTKGHGLGLSIVRRIMEKLGGEAGVESEVGAGSLFYFTLPAADLD